MLGVAATPIQKTNARCSQGQKAPGLLGRKAGRSRQPPTSPQRALSHTASHAPAVAYFALGGLGRRDLGSEDFGAEAKDA